ncbi:MAG: VWA domain-containing protein [Dehalococcoidia bacterium]|nr:VWA domain-containing protein [Dehalococcoidia bacterium]
MRILATALAAAAFLLAGSAFAADPVRVEITSLEEQPGKLTVSVSVVGADGRAATGLTASSFRVALNDAQASITSLESGTSRAPTSVLLLVDVSGSMQGEFINQARQALQEFVRGLEPADQVSVMSFATSVALLQDYTTDRALINQAIARLTPLGETALYDGVIEATKKAATAPQGRRLIVLLSDGTATTGLARRAASISAAGESGIGLVALGLGAGIDRAYLTELATATKGRFLEAPTTVALRQAYVDLAAVIRSQYTLTIDMPPTLDRTLPAKLSIHATVRADNGLIERTLDPLAGAVPPPFDLKLEGISQGQKLTELVTLLPALPEGVSLADVEYTLNGEVVHTATSEPFSYDFDPALMAAGNHALKVTATDSRGSTGEAQVQFAIVVPSEPSSIPLAPFLIVAAILALSGVFLVLFKRRPSNAENYETRLRPYSNRVETPGPVEGWPEQAQQVDQPALAPPPPVQERVLGRVVVMNEEAIRNGQLEGIREFDIRSTPLTLGSSPSADIFIEDDGQDRIAAEEARVWVQNGRLVYHKLTTLSAMATEGVTSGWIFLDSGDDMPLGAYRIVFQAEQPEIEAPDETEASAHMRTQEHGMRLQPLWTRVEDDPSLPASREQGL